jgi:Domain of unknown function (DUF4124)
MMMNAIHPIKLVLSSVLLLLLTSAADADVYKWVDKDGKIQYSDQPPLSGDAKKMKRKSKDTAETSSPASAPASNSSAKPAASVADQELEYRKRKTEKEEVEKKQQADAETAKQNKQYCASLKGDLRSHSDGTRLVRYNEKGERMFLDDKERADSKVKLEERIAKECN